MLPPDGRYTFEALAALPGKALEQLMQQGDTPALPALLGFECRGLGRWKSPARSHRPFMRGFFGEPGHPEAWGYDTPVQQTAAAVRRRFFKLVPASATHRPRYPHSLVADYAGSGEYCALNPLRACIDYLVQPDPANPGLLLGKRYLTAGSLRLPLGYLLLERHGASGYGRTSHFFTRRELRTVEAFAAVFFGDRDAVLTPAEVAWNVDRQLARIDSKRTRSLKLVLFLVEYLLPRRSWWPFRRPFSRMDPVRRRHFVEQTIQNPRNRGPLRDLAKIRTVFVAGYYGDPRVYPSLSFVPVAQRPHYQPDKLKPLGLPALKLEDPAAASIDCDVCVIGSGAAGAVVAYHAAAAGQHVVLLEEGRYVRAADIRHDEGVMSALLYKEGGLQTTVDLDLALLQGQCLGGTTVINNAICFRLNDPLLNPPSGPDVLAQWAALGASIDPAGLAAAYDRVEQMIGVDDLLRVQDPGVPPIDGANARVLLDGWRALAQRHPALAGRATGLFRKNYHRCLGCGYCNFGCPYERKASMLETYIPAAVALGGRVIVDCHAVQIERQGRRATGVRCVRRDGRPLHVRARAVVLACGAIGSSVLLMKSGLRRNVGSRFSFNAATPVFARFPEPLQSFDGVQMAAYIDGGGYLLESTFNPPLAFGSALPGWFEDHADRMRAYDRFASAGVVVGTAPEARVKRAAFFRDLFGPVAYRMGAPDLAMLRHGIGRLAQVYFAAGAATVYPATFADAPLDAAHFADNPEALRRFLDECIRKPEDLTLSSAHPQGGNPMSDDPRIGVVDSTFRVHGFDGLYVCDASIFPTSIGINPQLTIMALADYFAQQGVPC